MEQEALPAESKERKWFSVIGVAVLLTAVALWAGHLDRVRQGGAIALLLLFGSGFALLVAGLFLDKLASAWPARALVAGGLAAFYFAAFASYYFPHLRLINQPVLGCAVLTIAAILIVWMSERRTDDRTTFLVVIFAGFTTALQPVQWFTLFSNALLIGAACWLLVRHGSALLAFVTLIASYFTYALWWSYHDGQLDLARYLQIHEFWQTSLLFGVSWLVVVIALCLATGTKLAPTERLLLLSLNHALFFSLIVLVLPPMHSDWLSLFALGFGLLMVIAAFIIKQRDPSIWDPASQQGLLVFALGLFTAVAGPHWALVLAITSALLLVTGRALDNQWTTALRIASGILALAACLLAWKTVSDPSDAGRMVGLIAGLVLLGCASLARPAATGLSKIDWRVVYFAALGMALLLVTIIYQFPPVIQAPLLAIVAFAITISAAVIRVPELPYLAKGFVLAALVLWLAQIGSFDRAWWNPVVVVLVTLFVSRWWQTRGAHLIPRWELILVQMVAAIGVVAGLFFWLGGSLTPRWWLVVASTLSIVTFFYAILTRDWAIAILGQTFSIASLYEFCAQLSQNPPASPVFALIPIAMFLGLAIASARARLSVIFKWIPTVFHALAVLCSIAWILVYVSADWRFILLEVLGFALLLWARIQEEKAAMLGSLAFTSAAVLVVWVTDGGSRGFHFQDLIAFALLLLQQQLSKPLVPSPDVQNVAMSIGIVTLWRWVSLWSAWHFGMPSLTIAWAVLGLVVFLIGIVFEETMYRRLGWGLLIAAAFRVLLVESHSSGRLVILHLAVVGIIMLVATFCDRALFARLFGLAKPRT
jgi:hypothetical protein